VLPAGLRVTCCPVPARLNCHSPSFTQVPPLLVPACWVWLIPVTVTGVPPPLLVALVVMV
jgi:hypothetical protein